MNPQKRLNLLIEYRARLTTEMFANIDQYILSTRCPYGGEMPDANAFVQEMDKYQKRIHLLNATIDKIRVYMYPDMDRPPSNVTYQAEFIPAHA